MATANLRPGWGVERARMGYLQPLTPPRDSLPGPKPHRIVPACCLLCGLVMTPVALGAQMDRPDQQGRPCGALVSVCPALRQLRV